MTEADELRRAADPLHVPEEQDALNEAAAAIFWCWLDEQPGFREGMERARADFEAGRFERFRSRRVSLRRRVLRFAERAIRRARR